jgi:hypothetical protein
VVDRRVEDVWCEGGKEGGVELREQEGHGGMSRGCVAPFSPGPRDDKVMATMRSLCERTNVCESALIASGC